MCSPTKIVIAILVVLIIVVLAWAVVPRLAGLNSDDKEEYYGDYLPWHHHPIHVSAPLARYFWLYRYPYNPYFH